ncbi:MAG: autotransporter-associated beta strand repeat-containing protein, partial [Verrucomicrobiaceae bacterium]|nr:autotransporter-associated beta strand repeat-containing protein [Verrucomicrobiaceae bacterium]
MKKSLPEARQVVRVMRVHACERRCLHLALLLAGFAPLSNAQTIQWDGGAGGGTAWLTGTNWAGDATPGALNTAEFAGAGTATIIGVTMSNPTNNGTANQIVGMIRQVGGSARTVRNGSTTTPGTLTLAGVGGVLLENTSANNLSITDGTSQVMNLQFQSAGNINVTSSGLITISSSIIGTNGFVKTGSGRLDLTNSGGSSHTGTVTLQEGTLRIANGAAALGALPTSPTQVVFLEAGTFIADTTSNSGTNRQFGIGPASGAGAATIETPAGREFTISGVIGDNNAGTGSLIKTGDGTLVLGNGSNTYSGTTTIQAGVLSISSGTSLGPAPGSPAEKIFINGGSLRLAASFALSSNRGIVIGPSSGSGTGTI